MSDDSSPPGPAPSPHQVRKDLKKQLALLDEQLDKESHREGRAYTRLRRAYNAYHKHRLKCDRVGKKYNKVKKQLAALATRPDA